MFQENALMDERFAQLDNSNRWNKLIAVLGTWKPMYESGRSEEAAKIFGKPEILIGFRFKRWWGIWMEKPHLAKYIVDLNYKRYKRG